MSRARRRLLSLVFVLPLWLIGTALLYQVGMQFLEGESRSFWRGLEWAAETLSTTGYGSDSQWTHPLMVVFVIIVQLAGVFLVFLVFPIYLLPFLEERFEARLPTEAVDLSDHIVIYRFGPAVESFLGEMDKAGLNAVVVEPDEAQARKLFERGRAIVFGDLEGEALAKAGLAEASCLVGNGTDHENVHVILSARQAGFDGPVLAMVEEPNHRKPMLLAGATAVYTPRHILGAALAARASRRISPAVSGLQQIGRKLQVREVRVARESSLSGKTLAEAHVGRSTGVTVIGQWHGGELLANPTAEMQIYPDGILIVVGSKENIRRFRDVAVAGASLRRQGPFVVAGYGEVGQKVTELLRDAGEEVQVIDVVDRPGVDLVGDLVDYGTLEASVVRRAQAVILAVDSDGATLFGTVILQEFAPQVPVIARVNHAENVERIHGAGALFALSISQVSGQMLAGHILGEEAIAVQPQLKLLKVDPGGLLGLHPKAAGVRQKTGCSVVAVERGSELIVDFADDLVIEPDDSIYIAGSPQATHDFLGHF